MALFACVVWTTPMAQFGNGAVEDITCWQYFSGHMITPMESVDQALRLAKEHYAGMTEEEIGALAAEAYNLTEIGREALAAVIAEKGFKIQLSEAPPPEEPKGVGDCEDELDLETMCQLKSEADAKRAKRILDANFIASCLGPDNIADLENFKGSFEGGVDLKVFYQDGGRASRLLFQYAPDLMTLDDEVELDYEDTCPKCQSVDIVFEGPDEQPEDVRYPDKFRWTCAACGHQWHDEGFSHIVNRNARGPSISSD